MALQHREPKGLQESHPAKTNETCPRCGAPIMGSQMSLREMALATLCGSLLLCILLPACWMAIQWIDNHGQRVLDRIVWHEPLDNWSL